MAARPKFLPISTSDGWMVSVPANMAAGGKRARKFFDSETDAKTYASKMRKKYNDGQRSAEISYELSVMAKTAAGLLEPHGVTILDVARQFVNALSETEASPEIFRERWARAMLDGESHWSDIYAKDIGKLDRWAGKTFMGLRCALIKPETIKAALRKHGAKAQSTLDHRMRYVSAVLNFEPRHRKESKIEIMSLSQVARFIRAGETPEERRAAAVLLFAGIRPDAEDGEITRLDWSAFGRDEVYIDGDISKTKTDRHIPITPRLRRLIKEHPKSGPVVPPNWRRVYRRLRRAAGLHREQDITRHTFASNFLAAFGEHAAKQAMGHTANSSTLFRAYRRAITEAAGIKFFGSEPGKPETAEDGRPAA